MRKQKKPKLKKRTVVRRLSQQKQWELWFKKVSAGMDAVIRLMIEID